MRKSGLVEIDGRTLKGSVRAGAEALSYREVIDGWCDSAPFRAEFARLLTSCPFEAFFWETPPVKASTLNEPFEFVLVDAPPLLRLVPDWSPFSKHFGARGSEHVLTFPNLGGDAILVVPAPIGEEGAYAHLARFLRGAREEQVDAFWQSVGRAMRQRVSDAPTWLSTAGLGVSWLHLRLDSRPKYYRHQPYKSES